MTHPVTARVRALAETLALAPIVLALGCSLGGSGAGDGAVPSDASPSTDGELAADADADRPADGGLHGDGGLGVDAGDGHPLQLTVDVADGACADLSVRERGGYAVRFTANGPAGASVELWADKPSCGGEPFRYRELELDGGGRARFEITNAGTGLCDDTLLGHWRVWLTDGSASTPKHDVVFSHPGCGGVAACSAARSFCPPAAPLVPRGELFVLSSAERELFTLPDSWTPYEWGNNYEDFPLRNLWEGFDAGRAPAPLGLEGADPGWFEPDGGGSRNHGPLWVGTEVLSRALRGEVAQFEAAAERSLELLALDDLQGHMRDEAVGGYAGFWEGGMAAIALAGLYAPEGSSSGPELLAEAREWWANHVEVLRRLSMPDGQTALAGARLGGEPGTTDSWGSLSAAVNLQLADPRPHDELHSTIAELLTPDGQPAFGPPGVPIRWHRPRHVASRWVVLRAVQSGAIPEIPEGWPAPPLAQDVYRWSEGGRRYVAIPEVTGLGPCRWKVSWAPDTVLRVEVGGDPAGGGRGPHLPPEPLGIPASAEQVLGDGV